MRAGWTVATSDRESGGSDSGVLGRGDEEEGWTVSNIGRGGGFVERRDSGEVIGSKRSSLSDPPGVDNGLREVTARITYPPTPLDDSNHGRRRRSGPIILVIIILVLVLAIGILLGVIIVMSHGGSVSPSTTPPVTTTTTPPTSTYVPVPTSPTNGSTETGLPSATPSPDSRSAAPARSANFRVTPEGRDLDRISGNSDGTIDVSYNGLYLSFYRTTAPWTGSSDPSYADCAKQVEAQPYSTNEARDVSYRSGIAVCALTSAGNMSFVKLGPASGDGVQAAVTLWSGG